MTMSPLRIALAALVAGLGLAAAPQRADAQYYDPWYRAAPARAYPAPPGQRFIHFHGHHAGSPFQKLRGERAAPRTQPTPPWEDSAARWIGSA